jgi:hypothetical protein
MVTLTGWSANAAVMVPGAPISAVVEAVCAVNVIDPVLLPQEENA